MVDGTPRTPRTAPSAARPLARRLAAPRAAARLAAALALPLLLTACAGEAPDEQPATPAQAPTSAPAAAPGVVPTAVESSQAADVEQARVVTLTVAGGQVTGDTGRVPVELGERVRLTVTADVTDEIHVHGYDLHQDTSPGTAVELELVADRPGVFEVELEESGLLLTRLQVQ